MYVVKGSLFIKPDPEVFLGLYGIYHSHRPDIGTAQATEHSITFKHRTVANLVAGLLRRVGQIPAEAEVEHITSAHQAKKYAAPTELPFAARSSDRPDLLQILGDQMPRRSDILSGEAQLSKDRCFPSHRLPIFINRQIIQKAKFDPASGWQHIQTP